MLRLWSFMMQVMYCKQDRIKRVTAAGEENENDKDGTIRKEQENVVMVPVTFKTMNVSSLKMNSAF